ncbi:trypsin [Lachnoclostridium sp. An169]|uniref:S1C family serine protease n=1 Tax=Lachnoclostridium sp. An169 TaxID=1965569 RepID=UPI000B39EDF3|nr:S1C family serine protease [Lachnoclostridium sp. An169]OUP81532.1 trypsin [Lachnoclostridium sp. An169]
MPNDREQNPGPEKEPKYSFLKETIKPKPISGEKLFRQFVRIAIYGVILGAFACVGFFALKPWAQEWFRGTPDTVSIPADEEPDTEPAENEDPEQQTVPVLDAASGSEIMDSMYELAEEGQKGIVTVKKAATAEQWGADTDQSARSVTGVITADNGQELLILADNSICSDAQSWTVTFADGSSYAASLKKQDRNTGLAVFSVPHSDISSATWNAVKVSVLGNSNLMTRGEQVIALGNMFGYADGVGYGVISSGTYKMSLYDGDCDIIATDIAAADGGTGVLLNLNGEVIGLISPDIWADRGMNTANAYAISDIKTVIELLANGQSVPYIGISGTTVTGQIQESQGMPEGVYVIEVDPDSPAMAAGIQSGDVICEVSGQTVTNLGAYQRAVLETETGTQITIRGMRQGAEGYVEVKFTVTVGSKE